MFPFASWHIQKGNLCTRFTRIIENNFWKDSIGSLKGNYAPGRCVAGGQGELWYFHRTEVSSRNHGPGLRIPNKTVRRSAICNRMLLKCRLLGRGLGLHHEPQQGKRSGFPAGHWGQEVSRRSSLPPAVNILRPPPQALFPKQVTHSVFKQEDARDFPYWSR